MEHNLPDDFDADVYLTLNADLTHSGVDPKEHYLLFGRAEIRPYKLADLPYDQDGLRSVHNHDFVADPDFHAAYARGVQAAGVDFEWHWRVHFGLWAADVANKRDGDFVECGVGKGFLSSAIMTHLNWTTTGRTFYLLDTFYGVDGRYVTDVERANGVADKNAAMIEAGVYPTAQDAVVDNFAEWENVRIIAGPVPETLDQIDAEQIAFLHIDMNCAPPEIAAIERLWPRVVSGSPILLDDYAYRGYEEQKAAMDGFAKSVGVAILSSPTGQGLIIKP